MKSNFIFFVALTGIIFQTGVLHAQTISIGGLVPNPLTISKAELKSLSPAVSSAKGHDNKIHRYSGVRLWDVLSLAGFTSSEAAKLKTVNCYLELTAADNYKVVIALAEIDPQFTDKTVILADKADGKALSVTDGHFQIIIPGEKKHGRWIRQVTRIRLLSIQ